MKTKFSGNAFSKMYMVGPAVYNKLLSCIDEIEKKETIDMNKDDKTEEIRPAEQYLAQLNSSPESPPEENGEMIIENNNETPHSNQSISNSNGVSEERYGPPVIESNLSDAEPLENISNNSNSEISNNPLNSPCQVESPCSRNKPVTNLRPKTGYITTKNKKLTSLPSIKGTFKNKRYECEICGKSLARPFGLVRHRLSLHSDVYPTKESAKVPSHDNSNSHEGEGDSGQETLKASGEEMSGQEDSHQNDFENWSGVPASPNKAKRQTVIIPLIRKPLKRSLKDTGFVTSSKIPTKKVTLEKGIKRTSSEAKHPNKPTKKFQSWNE